MLYPCRECGNDVSQGARRCPYCRAERPTERSVPNPKAMAKPDRSSRRAKLMLQLAGSAIGILIVMSLFTDFLRIPESPPKSEKNRTVLTSSRQDKEIERISAHADHKFPGLGVSRSQVQSKIRSFQPKIEFVETPRTSDDRQKMAGVLERPFILVELIGEPDNLSKATFTHLVVGDPDLVEEISLTLAGFFLGVTPEWMAALTWFSNSVASMDVSGRGRQTVTTRRREKNVAVTSVFSPALGGGVISVEITADSPR